MTELACCPGCGAPRLNRARRTPKLTQPSSAFGSPETLVSRGTLAFARRAAELGDDIARRVDGKRTAKSIRKAIDAAVRAWPTRRFAEPLQRELVHGSMLGALDADFEGRRGAVIRPASFRALHDALLLAADPKDSDPAFAKRPQAEAVAEFKKKQVVTRDLFDRIQAAQQRRAFTVANAATKDVANAVKRELVSQVAQGADLRDFKKHAVERLESAGWTPQNSSHVETVFRTNVVGAYNAGRAQQMSQPAVVRARPYWQIVTVNDGPPRQRRSHQAVHLVVLRADDPFWLEAYPPFGYNCRCRVRSLSRREGEHLVTLGSLIKDLPDEGFTSGLAAAGVKPVNDIEPLAENDTE